MKARFETPPRTWDEVLAGYSEGTGALTRAIRQIVLECLPELTEHVGGAKMMGYAQYKHDANVWAMISPEDTHVKLYFHNLKADATGQWKVEGTGKHARHVKLQAAPEQPLRDLLAQVAAANQA